MEIMVIRNHLLQGETDNMPPRGNTGGSNFQRFSPHNSEKVKTSSFGDDSWYESSEQNSPVQQEPSATMNTRSSISGFGNNSHQTSHGLGILNFGFPNSATTGGDITSEDYENEPPLLEELGVRFDHISSKTQAVLYLNKTVSEHILDDTDLAGPLCFCLLLGACLLLSGKVHFGYIYGFSMCGCAALQAVVSLMHPAGLDFWRTCSVLGYCLLPVIFLAALGVILPLKGIIGLFLSILAIGWSTVAATR